MNVPPPSVFLSLPLPLSLRFALQRTTLAASSRASLSCTRRSLRNQSTAGLATEEDEDAMAAERHTRALSIQTKEGEGGGRGKGRWGEGEANEAERRSAKREKGLIEGD